VTSSQEAEPRSEAVRHAAQDAISERQTPTHGRSAASSLRGDSITCKHTSYVIRQHTSAYVSIRQHTAGVQLARDSITCKHTSYVSIRQHTSAYVSIRQHTSAYVSIRWHTAGGVQLAQEIAKGEAGWGNGRATSYVSIRQHTSAYVSLRPNGRRKKKKYHKAGAGGEKGEATEEPGHRKVLTLYSR
jgi:hypothetical protein